jgi:hypothetical protein
MSNSLKRAILRQEKNIDIEITVVINVVNNTPVHTGKYRYLVSKWDSNNALSVNKYSDKIYDSYEDAENAAIDLANKL